jgi:mesencephalic astrocyte-derived neurotrophic factor
MMKMFGASVHVILTKLLSSSSSFISDPVKRDVAQPFSLGMPSLKVCQRISKTNPEICTVKLPVQTDKMEKKDISKLRVKQLKQILADRGVECKGCVEKEEFVKRVQETEHLAANDEF